MEDEGKNKTPTEPAGNEDPKPNPENPKPTSPATKTLDEIRGEREKLEKVRDEIRADTENFEAMKARDELGGSSDAGQETPKPKPETDEEFVEKFERGEVDLLKK